jgi:nitrate reductase gamma subunit
MRSKALFAVWPYVALALFTAAIAVRFLLARRRMAAASGTGIPGKKESLWGGAMWRAGVALLVVGHLAGVLLPKWILAWNVSPPRLYLLEGVAFASGLAALLGWVGVMWRHLGRGEGSRAAELADIAFLSVLGVALASGLLTAVLHRWGSSWGVMILTPYARSVMRGRPVAELASQLPYLAQLHVAAPFLALAVLPWTRLGTVLVMALHPVLHAMGKPVAAAAVAVEAWLRKRDPWSWIWPDED